MLKRSLILFPLAICLFTGAGVFAQPVEDETFPPPTDPEDLFPPTTPPFLESEIDLQVPPSLAGIDPATWPIVDLTPIFTPQDPAAPSPQEPTPPGNGGGYGDAAIAVGEIWWETTGETYVTQSLDNLVGGSFDDAIDDFWDENWAAIVTAGGVGAGVVWLEGPSILSDLNEGIIGDLDLDMDPGDDVSISFPEIDLITRPNVVIMLAPTIEVQLGDDNPATPVGPDGRTTISTQLIIEYHDFHGLYDDLIGGLGDLFD